MEGETCFEFSPGPGVKGASSDFKAERGGRRPGSERDLRAGGGRKNVYSGPRVHGANADLRAEVGGGGRMFRE